MKVDWVEGPVLEQKCPPCDPHHHHPLPGRGCWDVRFDCLDAIIMSKSCQTVLF